jgi:ferredoxin-NADP reductase
MFTESLTRRLLRSNLLEALTFPHGVDRYAELADPLLVKGEARAEITGVRHQTDRSVTLTLAPNENWDGLRAGQFVNVTVEIDGVRQTRPYSPASSEHAAGGTFELTVSTHPDGLVSRHLRDYARPGTVVGLSQADGAFVLPDPRPARVLLVSGGSGITPVMAMLRTLADEGFTGEIGFLNYARSRELALYGAELDELARRLPNLTVARGYTRGGGAPLTGRFCRSHLELFDHADAAAFVCGPPALIDAVAEIWDEDGLPEPAVETFTAPAFAFDPDDAGGVLSFAESGRQAENSGLPILEQAEDAGLTPDHGCRMGICNTCSCRKASGAVRNVLTGEVSTADDELIRICVSVPVGDVALAL